MMNSRRNKARNGDRFCPYYCCRMMYPHSTYRAREKRAWRKEWL